jgi:hypothetical protein
MRLRPKRTSLSLLLPFSIFYLEGGCSRDTYVNLEEPYIIIQKSRDPPGGSGIEFNAFFALSFHGTDFNLFA